MFWFFIKVRALQRLGLGKPLRYVILILFAGCVIAGLIYTYVFLNAANERSHAPHVHAHSTH